MTWMLASCCLTACRMQLAVLMLNSLPFVACLLAASGLSHCTCRLPLPTLQPAPPCVLPPFHLAGCYLALWKLLLISLPATYACRQATYCLTVLSLAALPFAVSLHPLAAFCLNTACSLALSSCRLLLAALMFVDLPFAAGLLAPQCFSPRFLPVAALPVATCRLSIRPLAAHPLPPYLLMHAILPLAIYHFLLAARLVICHAGCSLPPAVCCSPCLFLLFAAQSASLTITKRDEQQATCDKPLTC